MAAAALAPAGREYHFEDSHFTFPLTSTGLTLTPQSTLEAAVVGRACSVDTGVAVTYGQPYTVKLAADGDELVGRIETVENRAQDGLGLLVDVSLRFIGSLPMKAGETPAPGASLLGAGNGTVKTRVGATAITTATAGVAKHISVYGYDGTANFVNCAFGV